MLDLIACIGIASLFGGVLVAFVAIFDKKPQPKPRGRKAARLNHWL